MGRNWIACTPGLRLPAFPPLQPGTAALQAPVPPCLPLGTRVFPWLSTLEAACALAMPGPPHAPIPAAPHCLTCTCSPNPNVQERCHPTNPAIWALAAVTTMQHRCHSDVWVLPLGTCSQTFKTVEFLEEERTGQCPYSIFLFKCRNALTRFLGLQTLNWPHRPRPMAEICKAVFFGSIMM